MTDAYTDQVELHPGMTVRSHDDEKLGKIVRMQDNQLLVEKGFFFPQDYWVPVSAVENADDDNVYLNVDKDQVLAERWAEGKADWNADAQRAAAGYGIDQPGGTTGAVGTAATAGATNLTTGTTDQTAITGTGYTEDSATAESLAGAESTDTIRVPVYEEELTATKRPVEAGNVQINKDVVTEERTLDVPITEERVRVTRRAINRDATGTLGADAFKEGTIDVPVRTEEVDVQKRVRAAEEVDITKEAVQKTKQVTGTVRREVVDVEDNTTDLNAANVTDRDLNAESNRRLNNWGADLPGEAPEAGTDMTKR